MEGYSKGEICNRDGCDGIIAEHHLDGSCSCHINPPCSFCETSREYCPKCDWDGRDEQLEALQSYKPSEADKARWENENKARDEREKIFIQKWLGKLPIDSFDYRNKTHTHFSMIKYGVYPDSMTKSELFEKIKGTFGGRFIRYGNNRFEFVAYTD